jgi:hypothetical protein
MSTIYGRVAGIQVSTHAGGAPSGIRIQLTNLDGAGETVLTKREACVLSHALSLIYLGMPSKTVNALLNDSPEWERGGQ